MTRRRGFTIPEMLAIVAIIVVLIALLLPALQSAKEHARRAICRSNLHEIAVSSRTYAVDNSGYLIIARGRRVQIAFDPSPGGTSSISADNQVDWVDQLASVNLAGGETDVSGGYIHRQPAPVWDCPSRGFKSQWEPWFPQLIISYQYFGGILTWTNPFGSYKSRSPSRTGTSQGNWVLVADATMKAGGAWGADRATAYQGMPSHKDGRNPWPAGGNQVYIDGSAEWIPFERMIFIHSWGGWSRAAYFWQEDLGEYDPPAGAYAEP